MITSRIDGIGTEHLNQAYKTINGVGLCYFDPTLEILKEFTNDIILPVYPGEESKRQFYIVKDDANLVLNTLSFKAFINSANYSVKTSLNYTADFPNITNNNTVLVFFSQYPSGIIPITLYIKNLADTVEDFDLNLEIEVV